MVAIYTDTEASIWPNGSVRVGFPASPSDPLVFLALTRSTRLITPRMVTKPINWLTEAWHL